MAGAMAFFLAGCGTGDGKNGRQSRLVCTFDLEATVGSGDRGAQRTRHLSAGSIHAAYSVPFDRHARGERFTSGYGPPSMADGGTQAVWKRQVWPKRYRVPTRTMAVQRWRKMPR